MLDRLGRAAKAAALAFRSAPIEAGGTGRRASPVLRRPAAEIGARREMAGARASWLALNDPTAAAIVAAWTSSIVADGPTISAKTDDASLREAIARRFDAFWSAADAEGVDDLAGLLHRAVRSIVVDGESFIALEVDEAGELHLRVVASSQIDSALHRALPNGAQIVAGIELDARGRRVAYHVRDAEVGFRPVSWVPRRIDAGNIVHLFRADHAGQTRGLSWLSAVVVPLVELGSLQQAVLATANTSALFGAILTNTDAANDGAGPIATEGLEPGAIIRAPVGWDVKFSAPPRMEGHAEFRRDIIRSIAAGSGVPFELVSTDLSEVNFSSARLGLQDFRRRVDMIRKTLIGARLLEPVWRRFIAFEILHGRLPPAAANIEMVAAWPGWPPIDPEGETKADILAIGAGLTSRQEVIGRRGRDPREVDAELAADTFKPAKEPVNA